MKLHYTPGSPFARIIRVLLRELAHDCQEVEIGEFPPSSDYFAVNPLGQVPALETAEGVRKTASAAVEKLPVSAMATKVRSTSLSSSGMGRRKDMVIVASFNFSELKPHIILFV